MPFILMDELVKVVAIFYCISLLNTGRGGKVCRKECNDFFIVIEVKPGVDVLPIEGLVVYKLNI